MFYGISPVAFTSGVPVVCPWQVQPVLQLGALSPQGSEPLGKVLQLCIVLYEL